MSVSKLAFICVFSFASFYSTSFANAQLCSDLFRTEFSRSNQSANDFFREVAEFADPKSFAQSFASGTAVEANPVFQGLVASGVWSLSHFLVKRAPEIDRGVSQFLIDVQQSAFEQSRGAGRRDIRPRVMTGEERLMAREQGYGAIEGPIVPRSKAQTDREKLDAMLDFARANYARKKLGHEELEAAFSRIQRISAGEILISKAQIQAILKNPLEFAIVYAHLNGLVYQAGEAGMMLSALVPWTSRLDKASANSMRMIAMMSRASVSDLNELRVFESQVLEVLRREFAPHLDPFK